MEAKNNINWNATKFFKNLTSKNKLAKSMNFAFCSVSGLDGFLTALNRMQSTANFVCVSDISDGYTEISTAPHTRRVKTVFFAMRHPIDDTKARENCMNIMRELFRQYMSALIPEKVRLQNQMVAIDTRIKFSEIDRYFLSGCACAFFQVATETNTNLVYNAEEWTM